MTKKTKKAKAPQAKKPNARQVSRRQPQQRDSFAQRVARGEIAEQIGDPPVEISPDLMLCIADCERALEQPAAAWEGNCHAVASGLLAAFSLPGQLCRGHYLGPVSEQGYWATRSGIPFQPHAWIELADGRIFDPTRWSFEAAAPYLFCQRETLDYDVGGQTVNSSIYRELPPYEATDTTRDLVLETDDPGALAFLRQLFGKQRQISTAQLFYLAHVPLTVLGAAAPAIYRMIEQGGRKAVIPIDSWRYVINGDYENSLRQRAELLRANADRQLDDSSEFYEDQDDD